MSYNNTVLAHKLTVVFVVLSKHVDTRKMCCKMWEQMLNFKVNHLKKTHFLCAQSNHLHISWTGWNWNRVLEAKKKQNQSFQVCQRIVVRLLADVHPVTFPCFPRCILKRHCAWSVHSLFNQKIILCSTNMANPHTWDGSLVWHGSLVEGSRPRSRAQTTCSEERLRQQTQTQEVAHPAVSFNWTAACLCWFQINLREKRWNVQPGTQVMGLGPSNGIKSRIRSSQQVFSDTFFIT